MEGFISGYSLRVGSAVSLAQAGATVVDMQVAGRWKFSQMPAHYAKAELAERGAIARFKAVFGVCSLSDVVEDALETEVDFCDFAIDP